MPTESPNTRTTFHLGNASTKKAIWQACRDLKPSATLELRGRRLLARLVGQSGGSPLIEFPSGQEPQRPDIGPLDEPCALEFSLYDVPFLFQGRLLEGEDGWSLRDCELSTRDRRLASRVPLPAGRCSLRWSHLVEGEPRGAEGQVRDLSPEGVLLTTPSGEAGPPSGPFAAELHLGSRRVRCLAETRTSASVGEETWLGLKLRLPDRERSLVDAYIERRFPQILPRQTTASEEVAELMRDSGYLNLRESDGATRRWHQLESPASGDFVYRGTDDQLVGHISVSEIYDKVWMMHQLATRSGHAESGNSRRQLYEIVATLPRAVDGQDAGVLAYFNQASRWHQRFFEDFIPWVNDEQLAVITSLDRFERAVDERKTSGLWTRVRQDADVTVLAEEDRIHATALIRSQLPTLTADCFDIHPERLHAKKLTRFLGRSRIALGLYLDGELKAVALCELGARHASLFNLLNMAQLYFCQGKNAPSIELQLQMLAEVRKFYAHRGISDPIIVSPSGTSLLQHAPDTSLVEPMGCICISGPGLRQWENFCKFQMGRLYLRKQAKQQQEQHEGIFAVHKRTRVGT